MSQPVFPVVSLSLLCFIMLCLVPHDNLHTPIIDAIMTIIINVLKLFLPFYVLVLFIGLSINFLKVLIVRKSDLLLLGQLMAFLIFTTGDIPRKCPRFAVWWRTVIHTTRWWIQILHQKIIKRKWKNSLKNKNEVPSNDTGQKEAKYEDM